MNSCGLQETAEPLYVLAKECNLTTEQKAEVGALVKKNRPGVPFYITALNKTSLSESLVICKAYAVKHLPHEDQPITLCHPQSSKTWDASFRVIIYGTSILPCITSTGWLEFVQDSKLQEGDICIFEISKSDGRVIMVIHSLEGGYHPPSKEPESQNNCEHLVKGEATDQDEESDDEHAEPDCYYSRFANYLTAEEQEEIFGSASIQLGNPVYVTVLCKSHVRGSNNMLVIHNQFAAKHLAERSHDILLLRPNKERNWCVKYYYDARCTRGFNGTPWAKFVQENKLQEGYVCVFELMKGARIMKKPVMTVHAFRKVGGRFNLLG